MNLRVGERVEVKQSAAPPKYWDRPDGTFVWGEVVRTGCGDQMRPCSLLDFDGYTWYVWHENIRRLARTPFEERVYAYIERELGNGQ